MPLTDQTTEIAPYVRTYTNASTVCTRSSDLFYIVTLLYKMGHYFLDITYYIKWVTTSWTHSTMVMTVKHYLVVKYKIKRLDT